jgi:uncharacterized protein (DUF433 family)
MPLEDVIELMRKNIAILPIQTLAGSPPPRVPAFVIQFSYQDRFVAQRVTQDLVSRYIDGNMRAGSALPITLEMLDPASLPYNPVSPRPSRNTTMGLALGLTLGAIVAYVRRTPQPMLASAGILEKNSGGTPVFVGTAVPIHTLLEYLESDKTLAQFLNDFPTVTREAAVSALELAKSLLV